MRSPAVYKLNETKAVPEIEENQLTKEAPVNSFALKEEPAKAEESVKSVFFVSPRHALEMAADSLQRFIDVVDYMAKCSKEGRRQTLFYLSDDMFETKKRINDYLGRLEGTSS